jgi:MoaA/NifB/PqqE/SkfB family radical SAM enzyme
MATKTYCPLPFHHMATRPDGNVFPCCIFRHDGVPQTMNLSSGDIFNHPFLEDIRNKMKEGALVAGCSYCHDSEQLTGRSMRTDNLAVFGDSIPDQPVLTYIDLALSNVCNNRCRMCGPTLSTNWYSDANKLGIATPSGLIKHENTLDEYDLSQVTFIKLIGGEPLMEQEKFINILRRCNLNKLKLLITTNATVRPNDELTNLIKQCSKVSWALSIDSYGQLNDFLRKGSKWSEVAENLSWFTKHFPRSVSIHSVASIYNINCLDQLPEYIKHYHPDISQKYVIVDGSDWMNPCNLPDSVKDTIRHKVSHMPIILSNLNKQGNLKDFLQKDIQLNTLRNEHWSQHNPELFVLLKEYYE